jgi:class 3 adenylate cyclase/predicted ATPase
MPFLDTVARAKNYLQEHGRVSFRALKREFGLDDDALEEVVEELVDVQQVAAREGKVLSWVGPTLASASEPGAAAEGERRQLTVMFCDLVDSTDLSQRLDAEDLRNVVRAYQESASLVIDRYDGHIAQYLGDGLLVYFGYPRAHEDDAERAVRAGREILTAVATLSDDLEPQYGVRLAVRVGIHTGAVVVSEMGGRGKTEILAVGDTTNIAARLEGLAEGRKVVISDATLRLIPGLFVTEDLGAHALKGIAEPMRAHAVVEATGVRSRLDVAPSRLTPLAGREHELGLLLDRWQQVRLGEGQAVLISGEAGLGKSRLLQTLRERLAAEPHGWLECRCSPYTQGSAFYPLIELATQALGFEKEDDSNANLTRLERGVEAAGLSAPEFVPLLASLLSLPLPDRYAPLQLFPELQRAKTIEALIRWILALGERQPLVMLYEDLHWCDPSTLEFLGNLLERSAESKLLLLITLRPEFELPWPERSHQTRQNLERLSPGQADRMIADMTGDVPLPAELVQRIAERADGIPLFVEEITKMVLESDLVAERESRYELVRPLTELAIPATLQDSLMARLDRIREGKQVAQIGSALGREFAFELLRSVSETERAGLDRGLAQLMDAELLYSRGEPPRTIYAFKHAMIQDTAYQSLLKRARLRLHGRIARVLEEQFPERVDSEPEVIARHYDEAGLAAEAIAYYQRGGAQAAGRSANEEAIRQLRRALELLATLPETTERNQQELDLQLAIGSPLSMARGWADPECEAAYERACELASQIGEVPELPKILVGLGVSYYSKGNLETSADLARQALKAAQRTGDSIHLVAAHSVVGVAQFWQAEYPRAVRHFKQVERFYDPLTHAAHAKAFGGDRGVLSLAYRAWCRGFLGYFDRALAESEEAVALAREVDDPYSTPMALAWKGVLHYMRREREHTREHAEGMIAHGDRLGIPLLQGIGKVYRGWALTVSQKGEGAVELTQGLAELARHATGIGAPSMLGMLAEVSLQAGRHEDALGALGVGVVRAQEKGQHYYDPELHRLRGEILLDANAEARQEPETQFRQALEIARSQESKWFELRAATSLARLWHSAGDDDRARDLLAPVYDWFTEGFDTQDLKDAKALLEQLC